MDSFPSSSRKTSGEVEIKDSRGSASSARQDVGIFVLSEVREIPEEIGHNLHGAWTNLIASVLWRDGDQARKIPRRKIREFARRVRANLSSEQVAEIARMIGILSREFPANKISRNGRSQ